MSRFDIIEPHDFRDAGQRFRDDERDSPPLILSLREQYISDKVDRDIAEMLERQKNHE